MGLIRNIKSSIDVNSSMSVSSVSLLISSFIGFLLGLVMCFVLVYDVVTNGYIKTDLTDAGIFLLCSGGYICGSGIPKAYIDSRLKTRLAASNERILADERRKTKVKDKEAGVYDPTYSDSANDTMIEGEENTDGQEYETR